MMETVSLTEWLACRVLLTWMLRWMAEANVGVIGMAGICYIAAINLLAVGFTLCGAMLVSHTRPCTQSTTSSAAAAVKFLPA